MNKGFSPIIIIILVAIFLGLGGGAWYSWIKTKSLSPIVWLENLGLLKQEIDVDKQCCEECQKFATGSDNQKTCLKSENLSEECKMYFEKNPDKEKDCLAVKPIIPSGDATQFYELKAKYENKKWHGTLEGKEVAIIAGVGGYTQTYTARIDEMWINFNAPETGSYIALGPGRRISIDGNAVLESAHISMTCGELNIEISSFPFKLDGVIDFSEGTINFNAEDPYADEDFKVLYVTTCGEPDSFYGDDEPLFSIFDPHMAAFKFEGDKIILSAEFPNLSGTELFKEDTTGILKGTNAKETISGELIPFVSTPTSTPTPTSTITPSPAPISCPGFCAASQYCPPDTIGYGTVGCEPLESCRRCGVFGWKECCDYTQRFCCVAQSLPTVPPTPMPTPTATPIPIPTCTDSDGGNDYFTKGTAKESISPAMDYTDSCGPGSSTIPKGHELIEWNCGDSGRVINEYYNCPNGCEDGACVKSECTDSDGGKDYYVKGETTDFGDTKKDVCFDSNTLTEFYCEQAAGQTRPSRAAEQKKCEFGCKDGACVAAPVSNCTDSDDTPDYYGLGPEQVSRMNDSSKYIRGTISAPESSGTWRNEPDVCEASNKVREHFCDRGRYFGYIILDCPNGCSDGACISSPTPTPTLTPTPLPSPSPFVCPYNCQAAKQKWESGRGTYWVTECGENEIAEPNLFCPPTAQCYSCGFWGLETCCVQVNSLCCKTK